MIATTADHVTYGLPGDQEKGSECPQDDDGEIRAFEESLIIPEVMVRGDWRVRHNLMRRFIRTFRVWALYLNDLKENQYRDRRHICCVTRSLV